MPTSDFSPNYQAYMALAESNPEEAAIRYRDMLSSRKRPPLATIRQLNRIIQGDRSAWHAGAQNMAQAVQFIISNTMLKSVGLGVMDLKTENSINTIASVISEDLDIIPMNDTQKRYAMIAEHYGYHVYVEDTTLQGSNVFYPTIQVRNIVSRLVKYHGYDASFVSKLSDGVFLYSIGGIYYKIRGDGTIL